MQSWDDQQLALLRPNYPDWDIWIVPCYMAPTSWCAKPKGVPIATVNANSPEELIEKIAASGLLPSRKRTLSRQSLAFRR